MYVNILEHGTLSIMVLWYLILLYYAYYHVLEVLAVHSTLVHVVVIVSPVVVSRSFQMVSKHITDRKQMMHNSQTYHYNGR